MKKNWRSEVARLCWEELKEKGGKEMMKSNWEEEKYGFFKDRGVKFEEMERRRREEGDWFEEIMKVEKRTQIRERWESIW